MKRLILIDGNAILHRAYHALPPLMTSRGELVNAVFGFCSMLLKVIADLRPDYLAVAFDRPKPTFRQQMYVGYQAQRPKMAEDLTPQVDLVHKVLATMGIPVYEVDGFEADDVIGTLAKQAKDQVIIVSGDRDMLQLIGEKIKVYAPIIGLSQTALYDEKAVEAKYGISPSQMVDYKALVGDPSDNYPGVAGVGPKTAKELLQCFKTLEQIYKNLDKISPKVAKNLAEEVEAAGLAKKLATIVTDVPIKLDPKKCLLSKLDKAKVVKLFEELEFRSLIPRLRGKINEKIATQKVQKPKEENTEKNEQLSLV